MSNQNNYSIFNNCQKLKKLWKSDYKGIHTIFILFEHKWH